MNARKIFFGSKIFLAFILFALPATFAVLRHQGFLMVLAAFGAAAIGYLLPDNIVSKKIRKRQEAINSGLPDALDFLVICVEAGLGLNTALVRVGKEMMTQCREFSEELLMVNQEMLSGLSRTQALHNLAERNQSKYLRVLVSAITISDRLGTDIADTLRAQSDSLRTQFRQQTEEQAAKSGLKMLLPLALFIFPTLFIIILGPAVINLIQTVFPNMNR